MGRTHRSRGAVRRDQGAFAPGVSAIPDGIAFQFPPPAIPGVGTSGGVTSSSRTARGRTELPSGEPQQFRRRASGRRSRPLSRPAGERAADLVDVDRDKALKQGVSLAVYQTLQAFMGGDLSTTSTCSDGSGRFTSRRRASSARERQLGQFYVRNSRATRCRCPL